jgi:hypothetical protein
MPVKSKVATPEAQEFVMKFINSRLAALLAALASAPSMGAGGGNIIQTYSVTGKSVTPLPMIYQPIIEYSYAYDINNGGDIVGRMRPGGDDLVWLGESAFIHMDGQTYSLFPPGGWQGGSAVAAARGINDSRLVVGEYQDTSTIPFRKRGFYYFPGIWHTPLQSKPAGASMGEWSAEAKAVNNSGYIVGRINFLSGEQLPSCRQAPAAWLSYQSIPFSLICFPDAYVGNDLVLHPEARDVNDSYQIVGSDGGATEHAMFLWKNGAMHAVPKPQGAPSTNAVGAPLKGVAFGINNTGKVVGTYGYPVAEFATENPQHMPAGSFAFVWDGESAESQSIAVPSNTIAADAREINSQGMVAGTIHRGFPFVPGSPDRFVAFIWHKNFGLVQLPALDHTPQIGALKAPRNCAAMSINNRRSSGLVQVAGYCDGANGHARAVRWDIQVAVQTQVLDDPVQP